MTDSTSPPAASANACDSGELEPRQTFLFSKLDTLMDELEHGAASPVGVAAAKSPSAGPEIDNQLVQVRLGIASSLFTALRLKHAATASHALRVALDSSAWATRMALPSKERDVLEVAALLHDVGMIGVPDHILLKPGPLDSKEVHAIHRARAMSLEVLRSACAEAAVLEIVEQVGTWYDGCKPESGLAGEEIPLGARMITIVEAFDAMTTDQVFRPALSLERATNELFEFAGTQFDPKLVKQFVEIQSGNPSRLRREAAARWLHSLDPETASSFWGMGPTLPKAERARGDDMFQARLLDNMHDAVAFIDAALRVVQWNHGAERLTGITSASVQDRQWLPSLLGVRNERGEVITEDDCPVICAIRSGVQSLRRLSISSRTGRPISVDSHAIPVLADDGATLGAILLLHDASPETSLEERCQSLHEKATKDPLTQVANRAEFDRVHEAFITTHQEQQVPCSLIICDLDHFKQVNDTYGHQAGDEAIKALARLLRNACRPGDLVARYGGEEFVLLCADCDNATTTRRADQIRQALSQTQHTQMDDRVITASFGVTEIQPGDTAETMLHRADRALLMAKAKGRNQVVQLGVGSTSDQAVRKKRLFWPERARPAAVLEEDLIAPVPITLAIEKLRGFVADRRAKIISINGNRVKLEIDDRPGITRRRSDRPITFLAELRLAEEREERVAREESDAPDGRGVLRTKIHVTISPRRNRDRRRDDVARRASLVLSSFRSYLMATVQKKSAQKGVLRRIREILSPWLKGK